jgi:hypothetical protein
MRLQVIRYLTVGLLLGLQVSADGATPAASTPNPLQPQVDSVAAALRASGVGRIEIVAIPPETETAIAVRPEGLEQHPAYRLTIRDVRTVAIRDRLSQALDSLTVRPSSDAGDIRWGVIFYDIQGKRLLGVFFDRDGKRGAIDSAGASMGGQFYNWLNRTYADCFK